MDLLKNKTAVITGATSGIGEATAKIMADEGATVVVLGRNEKKGNKVISDIQVKGGIAYYIKCDVSDINSVETMSYNLRAQIDHIDVLVNNAGTMLPSMEIERMPVEDWKETFSTNIDGVFFVTRSLKDMIVACKGCIVNIASIAGLQSYTIGRSYAYSASKAALIQFTRQMALNYGEEGIRVNCICPGIIDTPMLGERDRDQYAKRVPLGYIAKPREVAYTIVMLASDYSRYITGAVIPVDGGVAL